MGQETHESDWKVRHEATQHRCTRIQYVQTLIACRSGAGFQCFFFLFFFTFCTVSKMAPQFLFFFKWLYIIFPELWLQTTKSFSNFSTHIMAYQSNNSMKFSSTVTTCCDLSHTRRDSYKTARSCMLDATSLDIITTKHYHFVQLHQEVGEQNVFLSFLCWRQWRGHVWLQITPGLFLLDCKHR